MAYFFLIILTGVKPPVNGVNEYDLPEQENDLMFVLPSLIITEEHGEVVRKMNQHAIAELTAELILRYYENDPWPFLERFDDESLWYGPAEGQYIKGRKAMLDIWRRDEHDLTFTVGDMKVESTSANASSCNVMLSYYGKARQQRCNLYLPEGLNEYKHGACFENSKDQNQRQKGLSPEHRSSNACEAERTDRRTERIVW